MKLTNIDLPLEVVDAFSRLSRAIGNPVEVESCHEHVETELIDRASSRIAELESQVATLTRSNNRLRDKLSDRASNRL